MNAAVLMLSHERMRHQVQEYVRQEPAGLQPIQLALAVHTAFLEAYREGSHRIQGVWVDLRGYKRQDKIWYPAAVPIVSLTPT